MNNLAWLFWDRASDLSNQRKRRVVEVVRILAVSPAQLERFLMLQPGQLTDWCLGLVSSRYAAMRLVRIHRVVTRCRANLPPRSEMAQLIDRPAVNGQSILSIMSDPYFLENRLEKALDYIGHVSRNTRRNKPQGGAVVRL